GKLPKKLVFSLASYMEFYKGNRGSETIPLSDEPEILELYKNLWKQYDGSYDRLNYIVTEILAYDKIWKINLNDVEGLNTAVTEYLYSIEKNGIKESLKEVLK
ncbi:MAG: tagaturonate reductase, partial [Thermoanaerobacterium sp.]|nr:tagaturonate reductase [Thermoanaerobacterium sp.]